jgi:hypothetical protein
MPQSRIFDRLYPFGIALLGVCALLLFRSPDPKPLYSQETNFVPMGASPGAAHFAVADFDGDLQPDLAFIRVAREAVPITEYSLDLKFSSGPRPAISIFGPAGGLQVTSQDVNGDEFADLVVTSLLDSQFVAILLNDGRGHFQLTDRARFPAAGKRANSTLFSPDNAMGDQFSLRENRGTGEQEGAPVCWQKPREVSGCQAKVPLILAISELAMASAGRAPPRV